MKHDVLFAIWEAKNLNPMGCSGKTADNVVVVVVFLRLYVPPFRALILFRNANLLNMFGNMSVPDSEGLARFFCYPKKKHT